MRQRPSVLLAGLGLHRYAVAVGVGKSKREEAMSVILALLSGRDAVVASDGREFRSARLDRVTGKVLQRAQVARGDFDKTFVLFGGKVVGAFSGLTRFSGKTVGEHIVEIVGEGRRTPRSLAAVGKAVKEELIARLSNVSPDEVLPDCRKVDVLLAGGAQLTRHHFQIARLRFAPSHGGLGVLCQDDFVGHRRGDTMRYAMFGDDKASAAGSRLAEANQSRKTDRKFMLDLATRAIEAGIAACGVHPSGDAPSCGGKVFLRQSWY